MRQWRYLSILVLNTILGLTQTTPGFSASLEKSRPYIAKKFEHILHERGLRDAKVGIMVVSLDHKEPVFEYNSDVPLNPASNLKIVTSWTALKELGTHYRFRTHFYANHALSKGTIQHLYVKGGGDPYLVIERLWRIAGDLYMNGLRNVTGDIIVDGSFFDQDSHTDHWDEEPGPQAYFAPTAALAVNFNTVAFYITPGKKPGDQPVVVVDPNVQAIQYQMEARTTGSSTKKSLSIVRDPKAGGDIFKICGQIPVDYTQRKPLYRNICQPLNYAGEALKFVLESRGIEVKGQVRIGPVPGSAVEIFEEKSPPLGTLLQYVNKNSNNFMAEQILKTMAAESTQKAGRTDDGVKILGKELATLGFKSKDFHLENGSGLSHETRITPHALVQILEAAWTNPTLGPEFLASLALGGYDGTLEDRQNSSLFHTSDNAPRIRAKTGSLHGVSCISGYLTRADGETLAFSILMNNLKKSFDKGTHDLQDRLLKVLAEYPS